MATQKTVTIYSTPMCHFCHMAKDFFGAHGIVYTDYNVQTDIEKRKELIEKSGQLGVPVIFVDDDMVIGFNEERLSELLGV